MSSETKLTAADTRVAERGSRDRAVLVVEIEVDDLPDHVRDQAPAPGSTPDTNIGGIRDRFAELERSAIVSALEASAGNQSGSGEAARDQVWPPATEPSTPPVIGSRRAIVPFGANP